MTIVQGSNKNILKKSQLVSMQTQTQNRIKKK